jgi:hypothetical protein
MSFSAAAQKGTEKEIIRLKLEEGTREPGGEREMRTRAEISGPFCRSRKVVGKSQYERKRGGM